MIQLFRVNKTYQKDSAALNSISFSIDKGEFVFVTGPSGAGKSTLLKLLFCAETPTQGQILVNNLNLARLNRHKQARLRRSIGVVFQDFKLLNNRTVFDNVMFPLEVSGTPIAEAHKRVRIILKKFGLEHRMHYKPIRLSGGEQQRVAMARAIVNEPVLLLADEPTGNLDADNTRIVMGMLQEVNARGTTVIVATHDVDLIRQWPRRVLRLDQGRMVGGEQVDDLEGMQGRRGA